MLIPINANGGGWASFQAGELLGGVGSRISGREGCGGSRSCYIFLVKSCLFLGMKWFAAEMISQVLSAAGSIVCLPLLKGVIDKIGPHDWAPCPLH